MIEIVTERSELFDVNMIIVMRVRIEGAVGNVQDAFEKAVRNNGILMTRVVIRNDGRAFYEPCDTPKSSICITGEDLDKVRRDNEKIRFHIEDGEYIRAYVKDDDILFLMHHLGGDGKSLLYFIEDFLTVVTGGGLTYKPMHGLVIPKTRFSLLEALHLKYVNRKWTDRSYVFSDMDKAFESYWDHMTTMITGQTCDVTGVLQRLHDVGTGFTAYLIADKIKDLDKNARIGVAVDIRANGDRSMGNFVTGISFNYRYDHSKDIYANAKKIHLKMRRVMNDPDKKYFVLNYMSRLKPSLYYALSLVHAGYENDLVARSLAKRCGYLDNDVDISVTNLTKADIKTDYGSIRIKNIMFAGPAVSYEKNVISCCTVGKVTTVTTHTRVST